ncbi:Kinesin-like protein KIN-14S [Vitis vinifera]|uniref:Kinesin-like protein KIN-14S n=1 Tax=Vitis vinifera TaxID=29760 RepID=A0A438KD15_VITVI|nr:Kinesin-like protein KIN-14S [Vitis vinifera]
MVVRTPPKQKKIDAPLNPILLREPVKKVATSCLFLGTFFHLSLPNFWVCGFMFFLGEIQVDQCMARLQDLQYTVAGGTKVVSGETLSPRSTRGYLRTSLRCKQESLSLSFLGFCDVCVLIKGFWMLLQEKVEPNWDKMDETDVSMQIQEISSDHNQRLPVSQKIDELSTETQQPIRALDVLSCKNEDINADSIPGPEVYDALLFLGIEYETLKKKYLEESELLKKKYLEECLERQRLDFDSSRENELQIICSDSSKKQFKFDHVFRPGSDQGNLNSHIFDFVTLEGCFCTNFTNCDFCAGWYNVCIFAYGQTGTGKTFTMEGTPENRGVNYRTLEELFRISRERSKIINYELFVSMLEVYNEKIRDLLVEKSNQPPKK